ncbi:PH domain-containing protein [Haloarchaeobius sp. FL176]|uniref:PH domain-containing protein n=1 Tax=Haloarchaeobius sp. FL176 TaxID=2967129 RepID=UPI002148A1DA|nr:PH domain-containing protein [Haloarchaeobius sp. FL176]
MKRLHAVTGVVRALQYGVNGLSVPFFVLLVGSTGLEAALGIDFGGSVIDLLFVVAPLFGLLGAGYGVATYLRFEYELTPDTFDFAAGVVGRTEREIPLRRIQNVDISQSLWHRLFGVAVVRIETAGGGGTEAQLSVVSLAEANRLQREIRERRNSSQRATEAEPAAAEADGEAPAADAPTGASTTDGAASTGDSGPLEPLFTITPIELVVLSLTRFRPGAIVLVIIGLPVLPELAGEVLLATADPFGGPETMALFEATADELLVLAVVSLPLLLVSSYLVSGVLSAAGYYGFQLARSGTDLVYERGLVQRYSGSIPSDKIQTVTLRESLPMRLLGYAALDVETAGYAGQRAEQGSQSAIPVAERSRVVELARDLGEFSDPDFERPPRRARRRYAVRYGLVVAGLLAVLYAASTVVAGFTLWYLPAVLFLGVPPAAHLKWTNRGYYVGEQTVVVRTGFWRRRTQVVPYYRLQTVIRQATVFQRRLALASLVVDTASSSTLVRSTPTAFDIDAGTAASLQRTLRDRLHLELHGRERREN